MLFRSRGERLKEAGPSTPVEVLGLNDVPSAGERFTVRPDEKTAATEAQARRRAIEAGDMPSDSDGQGEGAGKSGNAKPVSKQLRIAELLPRARKRYEFAAKKSVKTRNVETPADTFTIRSMNHHAEPTILEESFQIGRAHV